MGNYFTYWRDLNAEFESHLSDSNTVVVFQDSNEDADDQPAIAALIQSGKTVMIVCGVNGRPAVESFNALRDFGVGKQEKFAKQVHFIDQQTLYDYCSRKRGVINIESLLIIAPQRAEHSKITNLKAKKCVLMGTELTLGNRYDKAKLRAAGLNVKGNEDLLRKNQDVLMVVDTEACFEKMSLNAGDLAKLTKSSPLWIKNGVKQMVSRVPTSIVNGQVAAKLISNNGTNFKNICNLYTLFVEYSDGTPVKQIPEQETLVDKCDAYLEGIQWEKHDYKYDPQEIRQNLIQATHMLDQMFPSLFSQAGDLPLPDGSNMEKFGSERIKDAEDKASQLINKLDKDAFPPVPPVYDLLAAIVLLEWSGDHDSTPENYIRENGEDFYNQAMALLTGWFEGLQPASSLATNSIFRASGSKQGGEKALESSSHVPLP